MEAGAAPSLIGTAHVGGNLTIQPTIDFGAALASAAALQGYLAPEAVEELRGRLARTEQDLRALRRAHPNLGAGVDRAIGAFNAGDTGAVRAALAEAAGALEAQRAALDRERARLMHAEATLLHPFEVSKAAPLLAAAADLANDDIWLWIDAGWAWLQLGDLAGAAGASERGRALAVDAGDVRAAGVALNQIGEVRARRGDLAGALDAHAAALARLGASAEAGSDEWLQDVRATLNKLGDVRRMQGDLAAARQAQESALQAAEIFHARDPGDPQRRRALTVAQERVADILLLAGENPAAEGLLRTILSERRALAAEAGAGGSVALRDVAATLARIGDISDGAAAIDAYAEAEAIVRGLRDRDKANAVWAHDLVAMLNRAGQALTRAGSKVRGAAKVFEALDLAAESAAAHPEDLTARRDLAFGLHMAGIAHQALGDRAQALTLLQQSVVLGRELRARDPANVIWARDVCTALWDLAELETEHPVARWTEALAALEALAAAGTLLPGDAGKPEAARRALEAARARSVT